MAWTALAVTPSHLLEPVGAGAFGALTLLASPILGVTYELATNPKAFFHKPLEAIRDYAGLGLDYSASLVMNPILGDPSPSVKVVDGGAVLENSFYENNFTESGEAASTGSTAVHLKTGAGPRTQVHELVHVNQFFRSTKGGKFDEYEAELKSGTDSYTTWTLLFYFSYIGSNGNANKTFPSPEAYEFILNLNLLNNLRFKSRFNDAMMKNIYFNNI
ncbi:hypothetical protein [Leptospira stimsonii]|uniref:Uncharacterized protein n=1 Tax=Leptospira stimsonii TaxID=2202203 RepID=A0A396YKN7_9LEPT|nr:hypothetical protein [Leptospira stimsonii]RHX83629.1 hypothetical protein DLM75_23785 [Leptospira stimsonii]